MVPNYNVDFELSSDEFCAFYLRVCLLSFGSNLTDAFYVAYFGDSKEVRYREVGVAKSMMVKSFDF
jgi:hypothetical protein